MMHETASYGFDSGLAILWVLHAIGMLAALVGGLLLLVWLAKTLTLAQMKIWGLWLFLGGLAVCLLTLVFLPMQRIERGNMMFKTQYAPTVTRETSTTMMQGMKHMMPDGTMMGGVDMMGNDEDDAMSMSMNDMAGMLKGKTGDDFDAAFLQGMIPHHQGAVDMAIAAQASAKHAEIKKMAADIITAQENEIHMMQQWQKDWGYIQ